MERSEADIGEGPGGLAGGGPEGLAGRPRERNVAISARGGPARVALSGTTVSGTTETKRKFTPPPPTTPTKRTWPADLTGGAIGYFTSSLCCQARVPTRMRTVPNTCTSSTDGQHPPISTASTQHQPREHTGAVPCALCTPTPPNHARPQGVIPPSLLRCSGSRRQLSVTQPPPSPLLHL